VRVEVLAMPVDVTRLEDLERLVAQTIESSGASISP
jgi:hypothetical protein